MQEQISFINSKGTSLSGILNNGRLSAPVFIMLHGFASDKNEPLFLEAETYFADKGYNVFRFDVEGAGDSGGDFKESSLSSQVDDYNCAINLSKKSSGWM